MLVISTLRRRTQWLIVFLLAVAIAVPVLGTTATRAAAASSGPCDVYASGGTPCAATYSTTRAMFSSYNGPLNQIQRASDKSTANVGLASAGGLVNTAPQVRPQRVRRAVQQHRHRVSPAGISWPAW